MNKKQMDEVRAEVNRWYDLMNDPSWDENTTAMWAMAEEIVRLRNRVAEQEITHAVQKKNTMTEIERLREELDVYKERNAWVERHDG